MMKKLVMTGLVIAIVGLGGATVVGTGVELVRSRAAAGVYRQRLAELRDDHVALVGRYNDAVRRTAVTELVVRAPLEDPEPGSIPRDRLSVRVRSVEGVEREIATDFDPDSEIYVDFAIIDGRVLIRRLFDEHTPPSEGLLIDASLGDVDWSDQRATLGKAVYRSLDRGRWTISVNGSGSIDLAWSGEPDDPPAALEAVAVVDSFDEIEAEIADVEARIGIGELWAWVMGADDSGPDASSEQSAPDPGSANDAG